MKLALRVPRWRCLNSDCAQKTFGDRLPQILAPYGRRTRRVVDLARVFTHTDGGRPVGRLMTCLGMPQSKDTLLRSLKCCTSFAQDDGAVERKQWREVADQVRPRVPRLATLMDDAEGDVLAYMGFPVQHRTKLHSTNPLERLNGEIKQRSDVVGVFPNEAVTRLIGVLLLEQNDEWAVQRARYMTLETIAPLSDDLAVSLPALVS